MPVATSTDVERAFSQGGLTVSTMRHSLLEDSTCAAAVLGSWVDCPVELVPRKHIMSVLKDKAKRSAKGKEKDVAPASNVIVVD